VRIQFFSVPVPKSSTSNPGSKDCCAAVMLRDMGASRAANAELILIKTHLSREFGSNA
jgi:hypothetical protein